MIEKIHKDIQTNLRKYNQELLDIKPQEMLTWGYEKFDNQFAITTSFGIQSSVLLNMVRKLRLGISFFFDFLFDLIEHRLPSRKYYMFLNHFLKVLFFLIHDTYLNHSLYLFPKFFLIWPPFLLEIIHFEELQLLRINYQ